jgi:hypothetical protein
MIMMMMMMMARTIRMSLPLPLRLRPLRISTGGSSTAEEESPPQRRFRINNNNKGKEGEKWFSWVSTRKQNTCTEVADIKCFSLILLLMQVEAA